MNQFVVWSRITPSSSRSRDTLASARQTLSQEIKFGSSTAGGYPSLQERLTRVASKASTNVFLWVMLTCTVSWMERLFRRIARRTLYGSTEVLLLDEISSRITSNISTLRPLENQSPTEGLLCPFYGPVPRECSADERLCRARYIMRGTSRLSILVLM